MTWAGVSPARLNAALLAHDSATEVLETLCGGPIGVERRAADSAAGESEEAAPLGADPGESVVLRRVRLVCESMALSEADLWYAASRLPLCMAERLAGSALPFGRVVRSLGLRRTTTLARLCGPGEPFALEHRAMLVLPDGRRLAVVHERYCWPAFEQS